MEESCFECGQPAGHAHHVVPQIRGGTKTIPLCTYCHSIVHGRSLDWFAMLKEGRELARQKTGWCEGRKRFGTKPGEEATLSRMKSLRADGLPLVKIADTLNGEGLATRSGGKWFPGVVGRILGRGE